jgi:hypothetical protein
MLAKELIEDIVLEGFKGLCETCVHAYRCSYHKPGEKAVIQCEMFEMDMENDTPENGLCRSCENASTCRLPGKKAGVWHCDEFE